VGNPAGAYLPRSPLGAGAPPAVRRRRKAPPARGAAASSRARGRRRRGRGRGSGQWSRSACSQWQCECGWGETPKKRENPAERDEEEGRRQEWDARLPTRRHPDTPRAGPFRSPLFRFAVPRAGRLPFHLVVAGFGLTGAQAQRAGWCTWRGPAHAARRTAGSTVASSRAAAREDSNPRRRDASRDRRSRRGSGAR
jgi:hypothetical protein